jgi:large subunit ribosomal protein L4
MDKNAVGTVDVDSDIFECTIKEHLMHAVVRWQLSKKRLGTASTKTRGRLVGRQETLETKHLGRARQGSIRAPQWRKGGIVFGPKPRDWSFDIPKKVKGSGFKECAIFKAQRWRYYDNKGTGFP